MDHKTPFNHCNSVKSLKASWESESLNMEQQTDNLVEEIYLSPGASLPNYKMGNELREAKCIQNELR